MPYIYFAVYSVLQPIALILQKIGLDRVGSLSMSHPSSIIKAIFNPYVFCGISLSAVGLIFWLVTLSKFNLSYIQPFGAVVYIFIAILSMVILKEPITVTRWLGIIVIVIGAYLIKKVVLSASNIFFWIV